MDEHHRGAIGLPLDNVDLSDRDKDIDNAAVWSSEKQTNHTHTSVISPSHSDDLVEEEPCCIDPEAGQSNNENVGKKNPDTSSRSSTSCGCVQGLRYLKEIVIDFILPIFSIGTYVADVGSDIWLAVIYAQSGDFWWFGWTLTFVVVAGLVTTFMSLAVIHGVEDDDDPLYITNRVLRWTVNIVATLSLLLPIKLWVYFKREQSAFYHIKFVLCPCIWITFGRLCARIVNHENNS